MHDFIRLDYKSAHSARWEALASFTLLQEMAREALAPFELSESLRFAYIRYERLIFIFHKDGDVKQFYRDFAGIKDKLRASFKARFYRCKALGVTFKDIGAGLFSNELAKPPPQNPLSHAPPSEPKPPPQYTSSYRERARGDFEINENSRFAEHFKRLKAIIKQRRENETRTQESSL